MAKYTDAINWIVLNDDTEWLTYEEPSPSVTACLVADVFGKNDTQVIADLRKAYKEHFDQPKNQDSET